MVSNWIQKKLGRLTGSNWRKLYILTSIFQLLVVIALESRVLHRNIQFQKYVGGIEIDGCNPLPSKDRMTLIIQENVIFMIFQLFQLWLCINAVMNQNTIQIITVAIINFLCGFYGIVQIFEIIKWTKDLAKTCPAVPVERQFSTVDLPLVVFLILFALIMALMSFKLYQEFGWNIYKKIGADINMQKIYRIILIFVMLLKLDLFFVLLVSIEVFFAFSQDGEIGNIQFTFTLPRRLYYFHLAVTIMIFFLEILAYRALRKEWKAGMITYITLSTITIIDFILILRSATSTVTNSWYFFIVFISVAIILCSATWVYALLVLRNFGNGLDTILKKGKSNHDPEVGSSTQAGGNGDKRFTIED